MPTLHDSAVVSVACMEHQVLHHIKQAIRVALNWEAPVVSMPRKLSSLQFTISSLSRHLDRLIAVEEEGGYMSEVLDVRPYFQDRIAGLALDHAGFRSRLSQLTVELNAIAEWDESRFTEVCGQLSDLLDDIDRHDTLEIELLQESVLSDDGGEG